VFSLGPGRRLGRGITCRQAGLVIIGGGERCGRGWMGPVVRGRGHYGCKGAYGLGGAVGCARLGFDQMVMRRARASNGSGRISLWDLGRAGVLLSVLDAITTRGVGVGVRGLSAEDWIGAHGGRRMCRRREMRVHQTVDGCRVSIC